MNKYNDKEASPLTTYLLAQYSVISDFKLKKSTVFPQRNTFTI